MERLEIFQSRSILVLKINHASMEDDAVFGVGVDFEGDAG